MRVKMILMADYDGALIFDGDLMSLFLAFANR